MCLTRIKKNYADNPLKNKRVGYKVLDEEVDTKTLTTPYRSEIINRELLNEVEPKKLFNIVTEEYDFYKTGYHIYRNKEDAILTKQYLEIATKYSKYKTKVFEVEYSDIVAEGVERDAFRGYMEVDVALKMKIIKEI